MDSKGAGKNALLVRFRLEDNPALSRRVIARYRRLYSGAFYRRFILGEWVATEGLVYDFFDGGYVAEPPKGECASYAVSCDYGTSNPASFGFWGFSNGVWYRLREYYYDSRKAGRQKTDAEYVEDLLKLLGGQKPNFVVADPSAASFIAALRREGLPVRRADNDVLTGIRTTADMLRNGKLVICRDCLDAIREFSLYQWDTGTPGRDAPIKRDDHAMDDIRYFAMAVSVPEDAFAAVCAQR